MTYFHLFDAAEKLVETQWLVAVTDAAGYRAKIRRLLNATRNYTAKRDDRFLQAESPTGGRVLFHHV